MYKRQLGGRKVWFDPDVNRINYDENGRFLGEFNDDDSISVSYTHLILVDNIDGRIIIRYFYLLNLSGIFRYLDTGEEFLDLSFDMIYIYITHDDNSPVSYTHLPIALRVELPLRAPMVLMRLSNFVWSKSRLMPLVVFVA